MAAEVAIGSPAGAAAALETQGLRELQTAEAAPPRAYGFEFAGDAREYFGIWIVNILLSLVTLGVYSAWAKVRSKRYFYGHTRLAGVGFDYLARPIQILKGRLVVVLLLVAWAVVAQLTPWADLVVALIVLPALIPWAVVRALSFSRRYSSYRNVRFDFAGRAREAFRVYVLLPVAAALSAGLLHPYAAYRRRRFQVERSSFGQTPFAFDGAPREYYWVYAVALVLMLGVAALAALVGLTAWAAGVPPDVFMVPVGCLLGVGAWGSTSMSRRGSRTMPGAARASATTASGSISSSARSTGSTSPMWS